MSSILRGSRRTTVSRLLRELEQHIREQEKLQEQQRAAREVELFESYVHMLTGIHREVDDPIDWESVKNSSPPFETGGIGPRTVEAEEALADYKPSLWDRLFRRSERKREALRQQLVEAAALDQQDYEAWRLYSELAAGITAGEPQAYLDAVRQLKPFDDLAELGSDFTYQTTDDPAAMTVEFRVHSAKVIPREVKSLTKTGKLSISKMPTTRYYGLEQDYVCSCALRIARDLFALLPLAQVIVHATDFRLNEAIGKMESVTILSVRIERDILNALNLDAVDPSEAMINFEHRMKFLKTKGFQPVERLDG